jgi:hypothetical protein
MPKRSLSKPKHARSQPAHHNAVRLWRPGYNFLAEFARAPDLLLLQGFLPEPIWDPQWDYCWK